MASLRAMMEGLGCSAVKTYIQSGNAVLDTSMNAQQIEAGLQDAIESELGFRPSVLAISLDDFEAVIGANPWPDAVSEPKNLHVWFLSEPSSEVNMTVLETLRASDEQVEVRPLAIYLHAPSGIGRSKLAARMESAADCPMTARNWRTVSKLWELARA